MKKIQYLLVILVIFSCEKKQNDLFFKKKYTVQGDSILNSSYNIRQLDFIKNDLLLASLNNDEYWFSLINAKTLEVVTKFGKKGKGPDEFMGPLTYCQSEIIDNQQYIWFYDINSFIYYKFNISNFSLEEKTKLNMMLNFNRIYTINPSKLIGNTSNLSTEMNRFQFYNPKKDSITKIIPPFPKVENNNDDLGFIFYRYNYLFGNSIGVKPDKTRIVSALSSFNRIDIYDINGKIKKEIKGAEKKSENFIEEYLKAKDIMQTRLTVYNEDIYVSNQSIYTLYYDQLFSNYGKELIPTRIQIFDWEGNPISEITVNDYLSNFTVDEKNGFLYGVDFYNEKILRYNIKHILDEL